MYFKVKVNRVKLFISFDALKGFKETIRKKERVVVPKAELLPDSFYELDWKIKRVKVVYYDKCEYVLMEGMVTELDFENKKIIRIVNKNISLKDIVRIDGDYEISKEEIEAWKNEYGIDDSVTRLIIK
ncbi:hypothetical protein [uncultured Thomasclavelia sp.]|uniref:hypothetical protein n=1 Tax=uncultured Thomasclavelia sp. TaxID=3025759 RepID=UPI002598A2CF|nr:hypothetical protein [uncultured Thomasclavelia sp.]